MNTQPSKIGEEKDFIQERAGENTEEFLEFGVSYLLSSRGKQGNKRRAQRSTSGCCWELLEAQACLHQLKEAGSRGQGLASDGKWGGLVPWYHAAAVRRTCQLLMKFLWSTG